MANQSYMTIAGTKQGKFKGQSQSGKFTPILSFDMSMQSPRDAATGQASGKRQHKPIAVLVPWTTACPQLFTAMMTNESLESVVFEFSELEG
jgi:type VI secretion system secreted protein Hcp